MSKIWWVRKKDLDPDQEKLVDPNKLEGKYIVTGPPGSGKSNLLILRAKALTLVGKEDFQILAYTQNLVRFLRSSKSVDANKIQTAIKWLGQQLWQLTGNNIPSSNDIVTYRRAICSALAVHLRRHRMEGTIHTLLIDEFQDYYKDELILFSTLAQNVFLVGDIRQQVYKTDVDPTFLDECKSTYEVIELKKHYRIGRKICAFADKLAKHSKGHRKILSGCQYDETRDPQSSVIRIPKDTIDEQVEALTDLCRLHLDTFPGEFIGVMCPTNDVLDTVAPELERVFGDKVVVQRTGDFSDYSEDHPIIVSTIHAGKGVEYRCVHIPIAEENKYAHNRELMYTAVTRARTSVTIYHTGNLIGYLEDAIKETEDEESGVIRRAPTLDDLFEE